MNQHEQGTMASYVIGFVLSLIFTTIPYYLVVNHTVAGDSLLVTIVGFAVLQMLIQIFFFLHIGRGPKPLYNLAFFGATVGIILVVVGGSMFIMKHLHYNMSPAEASQQLAEEEAIYQVEGNETGACQGVKANHQIIIVKGVASPSTIEAELCDTLSFVNRDSAGHEISFGTTDKPSTYAGEANLSVRKGKSETITLNQAGTYSFYDHSNAQLNGSFTVTGQ